MRCPMCATTHATEARFCSTCGWALSGPPLAPAQTAAASAPAPALPSVLRPPTRLTAGWYPRLLIFLRRAAAERTGLQAAGVVLLVCLVITLVGWIPLSKPPAWINRVVAVVTPKSCGGFMSVYPYSRFCEASLGLVSMAGSFVALGVMVFFRKGLGRLLQRLLAGLPGEFRFLMAPVLATILFTMSWAGSVFHFFDRPGIVRDGLFPPVVGLLTFVTARYGPGLLRRLAALVEQRDRLPLKVRIGLLGAGSWLISIWLTATVRAPVRDQLIVIIGTVIGYLLLASRQGDLAASLQQALGGSVGATAPIGTGKGGARP